MSLCMMRVGEDGKKGKGMRSQKQHPISLLGGREIRRSLLHRPQVTTRCKDILKNYTGRLQRFAEGM